MKGLWNVKMIAFSKRISWNLPADSAVLLCSDLSDMKTETRPQSWNQIFGRTTAADF